MWVTKLPVHGSAGAFRGRVAILSGTSLASALVCVADAVDVKPVRANTTRQLKIVKRLGYVIFDMARND